MDEVKGYQYWPFKREVGTEEWKPVGGTNRASVREPYDTPYGANYLIGITKTDDAWRRGYSKNPKEYEYKVMKRPYGNWEEVDGA